MTGQELGNATLCGRELLGALVDYTHTATVDGGLLQGCLPFGPLRGRPSSEQRPKALCLTGLCRREDLAILLPRTPLRRIPRFDVVTGGMVGFVASGLEFGNNSGIV
ncbi:MAG: hypothetical protein WAK82_34405 [Streptosporangiaceae bacterium]